MNILQEILSKIDAEPTGAKVLARVMRLEAIIEKACGDLDAAYKAAVPPPPPPEKPAAPPAPLVAGTIAAAAPAPAPSAPLAADMPANPNPS